MSPAEYLVLVFRDKSVRDTVLARVREKISLPHARVTEAIGAFAADSDEVLSTASAILVGSIFPRYGPPEAIQQSDRSSVESALGGMSQLNERFWGSYISIFEQDGVVVIHGDPTGTMPCYYVDTGVFVAFASGPALLHRAGMLDSQIDWGGVGLYLYLADLPVAQTCIEGLRRLLAGTAMQVGRAETSIVEYWSPWTFAEDPGRAGFAEYAQKLETVVTNTVSAWGRKYSNVLLAVSGGLDSSIIASCLRTHSNITCLTVATDDPGGDERSFAGPLCQSLSIRLLEDFYSFEDIDIHRSSVSHKPYPCGRTQSLAYNAAVRRSVYATGARAIITGNGGDNVFYHSQSARPLADRVLYEGLGIGAIETARSISKITGASFFSVLSQAYQTARRPRSYQWRTNNAFLGDVGHEDAQFAVSQHSWLKAPPGAAWGKAAHVAMLLRAQNHMEMLDPATDVPVLHPLLSQPIVELCLEIPTWHFSGQGRDRAVARSAFSRRLPAEIINRRTKGGPDGFAAAIMHRFRKDIRERLLDGELASRGLVDREQIDLATRPERQGQGVAYVQLLFLLDVEGWIEHWLSIR